MKLPSWIVDLFDAEPPDWRDEHVKDEERAIYVFNTYYRAALARHNPSFLETIEPHSWALAVIEDLSKAYDMPVPNNTDIAMDPHVYQRIQQVLVHIEAHTAPVQWDLPTEAKS